MATHQQGAPAPPPRPVLCPRSFRRRHVGRLHFRWGGAAGSGTSGCRVELRGSDTVGMAVFAGPAPPLLSLNPQEDAKFHQEVAQARRRATKVGGLPGERGAGPGLALRRLPGLAGRRHRTGLGAAAAPDGQVVPVRRRRRGRQVLRSSAGGAAPNGPAEARTPPPRRQCRGFEGAGVGGSQETVPASVTRRAGPTPLRWWWLPAGDARSALARRREGSPWAGKGSAAGFGCTAICMRMEGCARGGDPLAQPLRPRRELSTSVARGRASWEAGVPQPSLGAAAPRVERPTSRSD